MTDEAFNRYLKQVTRDAIPATCDGDAQVCLDEGDILVLVPNGRWIPRHGDQVALGIREAHAELRRRSFEG